MRDGKSRGLQRARRGTAARDRRRSLQNKGHFVKLQAGIAWVELAVVSIPEIAQKVDFPLPVRKKSALTLLAAKPDIGPQSSPKARAARMKYAACSELLRNAVSSISGLFPIK
jgi:hypothetical protein